MADSSIIKYTVNGECKTQSEWCEDLEVDYSYFNAFRKEHPDESVEEHIKDILDGKVKVKKYRCRGITEEELEFFSRDDIDNRSERKIRKRSTINGITMTELKWSKFLHKNERFLGHLRHRYKHFDVEAYLRYKVTEMGIKGSIPKIDNTEEIKDGIQPVTIAASKKEHIAHTKKRNPIEANKKETIVSEEKQHSLSNDEALSMIITGLGALFTNFSKK